MLHTMLVLISALQVSLAQPTDACDNAQHYKQMNLPPNTTSQDTEIRHAAAVMYRGQAVGWLYETLRGQVFYQDGPIDPSTLRARQSRAVALTAIEALGLKPNKTHIQVGSIYTVTAPLRPGPLVNTEIEIRGCY